MKILLLGLLVAIGGTISYFFIGSSNYEFRIGGVSFTGMDANLNMDEVHVVQNEKGVKEWELWADSAKVYRKKDVTILKNLRLRFYPRDGEPADVSAQRGAMENKSRNMKISGNVVILASNGVSMKTDSLNFHPEKKRIDSDARVLMEGARFRLSGTGLWGRTDLGRYKLKHKVSATIYKVNETSRYRRRENQPVHN